MYMLIVSFTKDPLSLDFTLSNYVSVLTSPSLRFLDYLKNSFIVSLATALISVFIGGLSAYAIARLELPGKILLMLFVLSISMFPQISVIGYIFRLMAQIGLINTYFALISPYVAWTLPLSLWILVSYFLKIPKELDESALVDGCTRFRALTKVIFPAAKPAILSASLLVFIFSFNEFMFALMLTTDHHARTVPVGVALFEGTHGQIPWGEITSASAIAILPVVILVLTFQKHIVRGLTTS